MRRRIEKALALLAALAMMGLAALAEDQVDMEPALTTVESPDEPLKEPPAETGDGNENGSESGNESGNESGSENGNGSGGQDEGHESGTGGTDAPGDGTGGQTSGQGNTPEGQGSDGEASAPDEGQSGASTDGQEPAQAQAVAFRAIDPQGLAVSGGICAVDVTRMQSVTLAWDCAVACDGYALSLIGPDGTELLDSRQQDSSITLSVEGMAIGRYTLTVSAKLGEVEAGSGRLLIDLTDGTQRPEGEGPRGGRGGGHPGGGRSGTSASKGASTEQAPQGFRVTPGTALTSSHASGTGDMLPYCAVALTTTDAPMTRLVAGDETLDIGLENGGTFTAAIEDSRLILTAGDGDAWRLNGLALRRLAAGGVETILMDSGDWSGELSANMTLAGDIYARLRSEGYVSANCDYRVSAEGVLVTVDGVTYALDDDNTLSPMEGD